MFITSRPGASRQLTATNKAYAIVKGRDEYDPFSGMTQREMIGIENTTKSLVLWITYHNMCGLTAERYQKTGRRGHVGVGGCGGYDSESCEDWVFKRMNKVF